MPRGFPNDPTEQDYYDAIHDALAESPEDHRFPHYPLDSVGSAEEWHLFKAALARWVAEQDREHLEGFEQNAREEHGVPEPLGWIKSDDAPEGYVSLFVVRHPDGISTEGAFHQRHEAERTITAQGLELFGATTGIGEAGREAWKAFRAVWG